MSHDDERASFGAMIVKSLLGLFIFSACAYVVAYFTMCEKFGSASFASTSPSPHDMQITWNGPPFLDRMYSNEVLAKVFIPAAQLETWATGVRVRSLDRSKIDFDFTIDDTYIPPLPDDMPLLRVGLDPQGQIYEGQTLDLKDNYGEVPP